MPGPGGYPESFPDSSVDSILTYVPDFISSVASRLKGFVNFLFTESVDSALDDYILESDNLIIKFFGLVYNQLLELTSGSVFYDFFNTPIILMLFGFGFPALMLLLVVRFFAGMFK